MSHLFDLLGHTRYGLGVAVLGIGVLLAFAAFVTTKTRTAGKEFGRDAWAKREDLARWGLIGGPPHEK